MISVCGLLTTSPCAANEEKRRARERERAHREEEARREAIRAERDFKPGVQLGLRLGLHSPWGRASAIEGDDLGARFSKQPGMHAEGGWRWTRVVSTLVTGGVNVGVGAPWLWGSSACDEASSDCRGEVWRAGALARLRPRIGGSRGLFFDLGLGWVRARHERASPSYWVESDGIEARAAVGYLSVKTRDVAVGVALGSSIGTFLRTEYSLSRDRRGSFAIDDPTVHGWLELSFQMVMTP
jgi:hypothetical protein